MFIGGQKLNPTAVTTYDETQNTGLSENISLWINKFWEKISFMVFIGRRHKTSVLSVQLGKALYFRQGVWFLPPLKWIGIRGVGELESGVE